MSVVCARCGKRSSLAGAGGEARCAHCGEPFDEPTIIADAGDEPKTERSVAPVAAATPWASPASLVQGNAPRVTVGQPAQPRGSAPTGRPPGRASAPPPPPPGAITSGGAAPLPPVPAAGGHEPVRVPGVPSLPTGARSPAPSPRVPAPAPAPHALGSGVPSLPTTTPGAATPAPALARTMLGTPAPTPPVASPSAIARTMIASPAPAAGPSSMGSSPDGSAPPMVGLDPVIEAPSAPLPRAPVPRIDSELGPAEPAAIAAAATLQPREVPQERSVPPLAQPLGFLREQPPPRRELLAGVSWKIALGVGGVIALAVVAVLVLRGRSRGVSGGAIVQVISQDGPSGAGFFVDGPDDAAYVATAFHLVASGSPISVRRWIAPGGGAAYAEAFPELDVVATDPGSDLAVLRLRGVPKKRVETLALASQAQVGEAVRAHGFSARARGPAAREGTIARADKLPSFDQRKPGAIDALLVSGELEPGFSGGPALDARGEVVGVGLTKDEVYQGPTALVNVASLRQLLATVRAGSDAPLTAEAVQRFLVRIEVEYLMLALGERPSAPLYEYLARGDLPRIHALASAVRRQGAASVALIPGRLETFHDRSVQDGLRRCATEGPRRLLEPAACAHLADAPLAWDFAAAALRWEGKTRPLQVTKLEEVDPASHLHRAEISGAGPSALTIYLAMEQGRPRLRLFDGAGEPYWIEREKGSTDAFVGRWVQRSKADDGRAKPAARRCEEVVVASREGSLAVTYTLEREARGAGERATRRKGARPASGPRSLVQVEYTAEVSQEDAMLLTRRDAGLRREGSCDASLCALEPTSLVLKRVGEVLHAYRTGVDGTIEISPLRKTGEGCTAPAAASDVGPKAKKGKKARGGYPAGAAAPAKRGGGKAKGGKRGRI